MRIVLSYLSVIDSKTIQEKIKYASYEKKIVFKKYLRCCPKEKKKETIDVEIKMIRTDWLFRKQNLSSKNNDFLELINTLDESNNQALYTTTFVNALMEIFYI